MHPVNRVFDVAAGPILIRGDFLETKLLWDAQANAGPALQNATGQKFSFIATKALHVYPSVTKVRVYLDVVVNYWYQSY